MARARGTFEVKLTPQADGAAASGLARMGQMLSAATAVQGSALPEAP